MPMDLAFRFVLKIAQIAKQYWLSVAVETTINGFCVTKLFVCGYG